jgi:archaellum component FlaC
MPPPPGANRINPFPRQIKKDNLVFRDRTWPSLVDLAGKIVNYAKTAGQDIDSSYYAQLLLAVKDFNVAKSKSPPDQKAMDEAKETIVGFTSELIGSITKLQEASAKAKGDLATFKNQTTNHSSTLKDNRDQVKKLLGGSKGEIARLEKDIKDLQKQLEDDQAEYDRGTS